MVFFKKKEEEEENVFSTRGEKSIESPWVKPYSILSSFSFFPLFFFFSLSFFLNKIPPQTIITFNLPQTGLHLQNLHPQISQVEGLKMLSFPEGFLVPHLLLWEKESFPLMPLKLWGDPLSPCLSQDLASLKEEKYQLGEGKKHLTFLTKISYRTICKAKKS